METRKLYFNRSQLEAALVDANVEVHIIPRGDGKTQGILARKLATNVVAMPKSLGVICQPTFEGMLTKTLPPVIAGLEALGYYKDIHYVIGKQPPLKWRKNGLWESPHFKVLKYEYFIQFFNGSGISLVSFNRDNSSNGISCDYILNDEAKFTVGKIKTRFFEELVPAMRGNRQHFEGISQWQGMTFTTDQPTTKEGQWLYEYEKMMDVEQIEVIKGIQYEIAICKHQIKTGPKSKQERFLNRLRKLKIDLNQARMGSTFYHEPAPMANFELLGEETYKRWKRVLPENIFRSSILNERVIMVDSPFYPNLRDELHVWTPVDPLIVDIAHNNNFDPETLKRDSSLHDSDVMADMPLDIAFDWGDHINTLVVGQEWSDAYHVCNAMFVKKPERVQDLAQKFCDYYKHHNAKHVNLPYDQTAYQGQGFTDATYISEVTRILEKNGWTVNAENIGQVKTHHFRYILWDAILTERDNRLPKYRFNQIRCEYLLISMHSAPAKQGRNGFEKDKKSERDRVNTPQEEATHFSDAVDTLAVYKHGRLLDEAIGFGSNLFVTSN